MENAINLTLDRKIIMSGDFNPDENKRFQNQGNTKHLFENLNTLCEQFNLIQIVKIHTWKRIVNDQLQESTIDHIYVKNPFLINNLKSETPTYWGS